MKAILIVVSLALVACSSEPEFYINGKPYYTERTCIKSHRSLIPITHIVGKVPITTLHPVKVCDEYRIDTLEYGKKEGKASRMEKGSPGQESELEG
jgi:hypothetical protein